MTAESVDPNCAVAHGAEFTGPTDRLLVAVFASPVSSALVHFGGHLGFRTLLVEPDDARRGEAKVDPAAADLIVAGFGALGDELSGGTADVVVTDHHRPELGELLRDALGLPVRWIGVMGNPRHEGPHVAALTALGVPPEEIARVHRPIGLDIGSRTPPEIAVSTLAGLLADRNGRSGGFAHGR
jgi:xanthine dehydrogenase accessory factor